MGNFNETDYLVTRLESQEQVLKEIIEEIHNNIGQVLSLAKLHLGTLDLSGRDQMLEKTESSRSLISKAIKDLRGLTQAISDRLLPLISLAGFIEFELGLLPKHRRSDPPFRVTGKAVNLAGGEEWELCRTVQELIRYLFQKSPGSVIGAVLEYRHDKMTITVWGKENIDVSALNSDEIANLESSIHTVYKHIRLTGASMHLNSILGNQTTVVITVPFQQP